MFAKLLKYEWKSTARTMLPLCLGALGIGVLGAVLMHFTVNSTPTAQEQTLSLILAVLLMFSFLALFGLGFGGQYYLYYRFYKNKFTDEGYLTFTLPVRSWKIFLASMVNIAAWVLITMLVMMIAFGIMLYFGVFSEFLKSGTITQQTAEIFDQFELGISLPVQLVCSVVTFISGVVMAMTCVTVGAVIAGKHKILTAIGLYYAYSVIQGILASSLMATILMSSTPENMLASTSLIEAGIQGICAVAGFLLSTYLMERKLNLP